ncbi:MAG: DUF6684 family protein [Halanaeroarchaeum sp.]
MASQPWTTETLLDISVNVVPLVVLAAFLVLIMGVAYWGMDLTLIPILAVTIIVFHAVVLAVVTYVAAIKIEA